MDFLNKLIYWISTGFLVPTVLALVFLFFRALLLLGSFYGFYMNRLKTRRRLQPVMEGLQKDNVLALSTGDLPASPFKEALHRIVGHPSSEVIREKVLTDYELLTQKELDGARTLSKVGPILGLIGTLIPIQPALVALSNGDLTSIAKNMQEGFASTIIGLIIGGVGFITLQVKQRWYNEELADLEFVHELIRENNAQ
ncbi:MAG: MotA/TolQ/ExbB proton channel family protein [Flavihumibacter sp.]